MEHSLDTTRAILDELEKLTGQAPPLPHGFEDLGSAFPRTGLGFSQLNELLLLLGYDRINQTFFQYLADGTLTYTHGSEIRTLPALSKGVERARILSLLRFGNTKFGFKMLAQDAEELGRALALCTRPEMDLFQKRHEPIHPIELIAPKDTYFLGYVIQDEIRDRLNLNSNDKAALADQRQMIEIQKLGAKNHRAYLASDHLDVYVATSMRRRHEYVEIAEFTQKVFSHPRLADLRLRWFDPTQAYTPNRIDKGLSEALMLKRATCTLYLAQEIDTLGKDSELATTLAQGKPVIAYVPRPTTDEIADSIDSLTRMYPKSRPQTILDQLQLFAPQLAWEDKEVKEWIKSPETMDDEKAQKRLVEYVNNHYDKRAKTLSETHPLGIQVNLETGVASGVLVVRNADDCAELLCGIMTNALDFVIDMFDEHGLKTVDEQGAKHVVLRERISQSVYRVMTRDSMLANSFWNFYLQSVEG